MRLNKTILITLIPFLIATSCYSQLVQSGRYKVVHDVNQKAIYYTNVYKEAGEKKIRTLGDFLENWNKLDSKDLKIQMVAAQTILNSIDHSVNLSHFVQPHEIKPPIDYFEFRVESFKKVLNDYNFSLKKKETVNKLGDLQE